MVRRLWLPMVLGVACILAWVASARLGDLTVDSADPVDDAQQVASPITSVRRLPQIATRSLRSQRVELALGALPEPPTSLSCVTLMVDGEVAYELRGGASLIPGYAQLLVTGHVALELLGPDHRFETRVMARQQPDENGRLPGDLFLVGGGDPVLMTYIYSRGFRPIRATATVLEDLTDLVAASGLTEVGGSVIGVERRYDRERVRPGLPDEHLQSGVVGPLSALQLDDGLAERPAANGGIAVPAEEPAALAAERFDDQLEAAGLRIGGVPRRDEPDELLEDLVPIASIRSAPLSEIVRQMWAVNDASAAEMLMKELGLQFAQEGSTQAGAEAIVFTLAQQEVELDVPPRDGSGLDPVSTFSCGLLASVLAAVPGDHPTTDNLPSPGLPGVYGGSLTDLEIEADVRVIGGVVGDAASFVATTVDAEREIVLASIVNRSGGPDGRDTEFHRELLSRIDDLLLAWVEPSISDGDDE